MNNSKNSQYPEERRLVTVLFADVHGFTSLADQLDFEVVSDLMRGVWLELDQVIEEHGGYIDKHMGDAFMVVWGAPQAREDDAERAVAAGLAILEALETYKKNSSCKETRQLDLRVGIHSGLALAGYVGLRDEYTVLGDTVNIAKRIEIEAQTGTLGISEATYQFVRGVFRMSDLGLLKLRGKEDPIQVYQVTEALQQPTKLRYRSAGGLETNLVSREEKLKHLADLYRQAQHKEYPLLAIVRGDIGLGKSRLMMEFASRLEVEEPHLRLISSRAFQQASKVPFYLWRNLWLNLFECREDDSPQAAREKFINGVRSLWGQRLGPISAVETAHLIGDLVGIEWPESRYLAPFNDRPEQKLQRAFALHNEILSRSQNEGPLVLALDDLQWADQGSMSLLRYLVNTREGKLSMFILGGGRPQTFQRYPQLEDMAKDIDLKPFDLDPELVRRAYPALKSVSPDVLSQLVQRAGGNPFYLEELVKSLVRSPREDFSKLDIQEHLPRSLHLLLQARLDSLSSAARGVALLAAVVGRVFWEDAVLAAMQKASGTTTILDVSTLTIRENIENALHELTRAEMAFPRAGSTFAGEREFIFKHTLLQEVAYSLLPHKYRGQCHLAVARWLAERVSPELSVMVAEQYEKADEREKAIHYYRQAARHATSQGNIEDAQSLEEHLHTL
ncbi:MAG: Adenylate cyclase 2 [Chloroflexi bacterium]|nr:Adenylate cyclase 2 [Chloroflexota bacterium]